MPNTGDYPFIRNKYYSEIYAAMSDYLNAPEGTRVTRNRNVYKRAINSAFWRAFETGYQADGAELPLDDESYAWILSRVEQEWEYAGGLFDRLRTEIKPEGTPEAYAAELSARSEGYVKTLDSIYVIGKVRGARNIVLVFGGNSGQESCETCQKLMGQRHPTQWWISHDLIPYPGNDKFDCGGWKCLHELHDIKGNVFSI
jgi:hypothetical protein